MGWVIDQGAWIPILIITAMIATMVWGNHRDRARWEANEDAYQRAWEANQDELERFWNEQDTGVYYHRTPYKRRPYGSS
jgi:hypothetical protein